MMDRTQFLESLQDLPLYFYDFIDPKELEFSERIRWICSNECPMYGKSWACPPAVGTVTECAQHCGEFDSCLMISTITEVSDITNIQETLATRPAHEEVTARVAQRMRLFGVEPYVLSTEACALCERCTYLDGQPCRFPDKMHPCVESHGINMLPLLEKLGLEFQYGENVVTWFSLLFFKE
jgi:predicted metal-binding protein